MTTLRTRTRVSLAARVAALAATVFLGACASAPSRLAHEGGSTLRLPALSNGGEAGAPEAPAARIHFDNQAHDYVRVYLVDEKQQYLLGRVERGASANLKIPAVLLDGTTRWVRLAVMADDRTGARLAGEPRFVSMGLEPVDLLLTQRWTFSQSLAGGQLSSLPVERPAVDPR